MKISRQIVLLIVLILSCALYASAKIMPGLLGAFGAQQRPDQPGYPGAPQVRPVTALPRPHQDGVFDDHRVLITTYPIPASAWQENEKAFYTDLLRGQQFDVLVVPFQVQDRAMDQSTRAIMTAQLSALIADHGKERVADPFLIARALGDGSRRVKPESIYDLANLLHVKRIVRGYVGHDLHRHFAITLTVQDRVGDIGFSNKTETIEHSAEGLAFSDTLPAVVIAPRELRNLLAQFAYAVPASTASCATIDAQLNASPKDILLKAENAAQSAFAYELYAALVPGDEQPSKHRFAEKAFLEASQLPGDCPATRMLTTRALGQLGYRSAALTVLGNPSSPEEHALQQALNGNYPELDKLITEIPAGTGRLLPTLDLFEIGGTYGLLKTTDVQQRIRGLKLDRYWQFFFERKFADHDEWIQQDNRAIISLLNHEFPVVGSDGSRMPDDPDTALFEQGRKYWKENSNFSDAANVNKGRMLDFLDLVTAIGVDNIYRNTEFVGKIQGYPADALHRLEVLAPIYRDQPRFALLRSELELALARKTPGSNVSENLVKAALDDALNAMYWQQGQSSLSASALATAASINRSTYGHISDPYISDLPAHADYFRDGSYGLGFESMYAIESGLENSSFNSAVAAALLKTYKSVDAGKLPSAISSLEGRFHGSSDLTDAMIEIQKQGHDRSGMERLLRDAIGHHPDEIRFYFELGDWLLDQGRVDDAFVAFMSYPEFNGTSAENGVAISNAIGDAARRFYHAGYFEQATKLYAVADRYDTGADSAFLAHSRLALMRGDLGAAMQAISGRYHRYGGTNATFEYISMLEATGHAKQAQALRNELLATGKNADLWGGAITGFRMAGASEEKMLSWAKQLNVGSAVEIERLNPAQFVFSATTFDRRPSQAVVDSLDQTEVHYFAAKDRPHTGMRQLDATHTTVLYRMSETNMCGGQAQLDPSGSYPNRKFIQSDRHYFVAAYRAMQMGDYDNAKKTLDEAGQLFDMTCPIVTYLEPYWAFAAAKVHDTAYIDNLLTLFHPDDQRFDYHLTKAVLLAFKGDAKGSVEEGHRARLFIDNGHADGFTPDYFYAEIMEKLYLETHDAAYRDEALAWLGKAEAKYPWAGWAYAMQAELETNVTKRSHAVAMARYLDPLSARLASLPKSVRDSAKFAGGNPLLQAVPRGNDKGSPS